MTEPTPDCSLSVPSLMRPTLCSGLSKASSRQVRQSGPTATYRQASQTPPCEFSACLWSGSGVHTEMGSTSPSTTNLFQLLVPQKAMGRVSAAPSTRPLDGEGHQK